VASRLGESECVDESGREYGEGSVFARETSSFLVET
jgi:hypothetical protein